jgi:hypothetical protein
VQGDGLGVGLANYHYLGGYAPAPDGRAQEPDAEGLLRKMQNEECRMQNE